MHEPGHAATGAFCWVDLAATDVDRARGFYGRLLKRVAGLGGEVIIGPEAVSDVARVALIFDPVDAYVGLWQATEPDQELRRVPIRPGPA